MHISRRPVEVPPARIGEADEAIARNAAAYIEDGSVIQTGVGAVPDAILRLIHDRKDLGVHSGMIGDGLVGLVEAGVVTNARKRIDRGVSITGALIGTERLYEFAHRNPRIRMCPTSYTHDAAVFAQLDQLVTINSAVEVDLTGQVNAEQSGSVYLGGKAARSTSAGKAARSTSAGPAARSTSSRPAHARPVVTPSSPCPPPPRAVRSAGSPSTCPDRSPPPAVTWTRSSPNMARPS